jgi:glycosyltransferase involved in cell wall biosynthesis
MIRTIALVCTHNGEKHLKDQIVSIQMQSRVLDKIYLFDFNSSDSTRIISREMALEYDNVIFGEYEIAPGPALSFFMGIDRVRSLEIGDYLLYMVDQDDVWLRSKNEFVLNKFNKRKFGFGFHDVEIVNESLATLRPNYYSNYWKAQRDFNYPSQLFSNCVIGHTCVLHSDFVRVLSIPFDTRIPMHDWHIANQALLRDDCIFFEEVLSKYRQHDGNILGASKSGFLQRLRRMRAYSKVLNDYHDYLNSCEPRILSGVNPSSFVLMVKTVRPVRKLVYVFFVKFIFRL